MSETRHNFDRPVQKVLLIGILIGFALFILGKILVPARAPLGFICVCVILGIYGLVIYLGFPKVDPEVLRSAIIFGLIAGILFVGEILLEYIFLPQDNTVWD